MNLDLLNFAFGALIALGSALGSYYAFKTKVEIQITAIQNENLDLKKQLAMQAKEIKDMKTDIVAMIDRNKTINETVAQAVQAKLESIGNQIVEVKTIIKYRLKEES